jgi:hypothetical protein
MSGIIWVLIPLAAILGWIIVEYQEYRLKMMDKQNQSGRGNEEFQKQIDRLKRRIENLEAIVTEAPSEIDAQNFDKEADTESDSAHITRKQKRRS